MHAKYYKFQHRICSEAVFIFIERTAEARPSKRYSNTGLGVEARQLQSILNRGRAV
jgi:hypothetical protein